MAGSPIKAAGALRHTLDPHTALKGSPVRPGLIPLPP